MEALVWKPLSLEVLQRDALRVGTVCGEGCWVFWKWALIALSEKSLAMIRSDRMTTGNSKSYCLSFMISQVAEKLFPASTHQISERALALLLSRCPHCGRRNGASGLARTEGCEWLPLPRGVSSKRRKRWWMRNTTHLLWTKKTPSPSTLFPSQGLISLAPALLMPVGRTCLHDLGLDWLRLSTLEKSHCLHFPAECSHPFGSCLAAT